MVRKQRREETGRVVLDNANANRSHGHVTSPIKQFIEKGVTKLEHPEAVGIYLFNKSIFEYLHDTAKKMHGIFNLSHDLLTQITSMGGKLYSYDMGDDIQWVDVESPFYADRNKEIIMKILLQMGARDEKNW